jgi:hypothetical protein
MPTVIPAIRAMNSGSHAMLALLIAFHGYNFLIGMEHGFTERRIWKKSRRRESDGDVMTDEMLVAVGSPLTLAPALFPSHVCLHAAV